MSLFLFIGVPALVCGWVNFPILWPHTPVQMKLKCPPGCLTSKSCVKGTCWDTRATDSIIKSGQKDTEASINGSITSNLYDVPSATVFADFESTCVKTNIVFAKI